jgi:hypothetical protein
MNRNELPFDPRHPGVPSGVSEMISKMMARLAQTVHLSCTQTNTISKRIETRFCMTHVTSEFHRVRPNRFLRLWYVWCKLRIYLAPILTLSPNGPNKLPFEPRHLGVPSGASKTVSEAMVHLPQTVYLSYTKTNTISKRIETRFYLTHVS